MIICICNPKTHRNRDTMALESICFVSKLLANLQFRVSLQERTDYLCKMKTIHFVFIIIPFIQRKMWKIIGLINIMNALFLTLNEM